MIVVAIGGSAGGVAALERLVADLPADFDACLIVTVHVPATARSALPRILHRAGPLPAAPAEEGAPLRPGHILVAPPDRHLLIDGGLVRLGRGPRVNRHRPSVDVMFTSAARWADGDTLAVVLSGALDDGAVGAALVAHAGGHVLVQDPAEARFSGMPRAALAAVPAAKAVGVSEMAATLTATMSSGSPAPHRPVAIREGTEMGTMAESGDPLFLAADESRLTRLTCPDCHGALAQIDLPAVTYYRCHVGHQWSPQTLAAAQAETSETMLWTAVAALEEQAALGRQLADSDRDPDAATGHGRAAERATKMVDLLRAHLGAVHEHERPGPE